MEPGIITEIKLQKNNQKRYSIFVDGEFFLGVDGELIIEYELEEGVEVTQDLLANLLKDEDLQEAKDAAFNLLGYRQRSRQELKNRLARKDFNPETICRVIDVLEGLDYIDDREFAQKWIQDRISRGFGPYRVRQQLREKGVAAEIIEEEVEANYDFELEYEMALDLAQKKKGRYSQLADREKWYKLKQVLKRKGFSFEVIDIVLEDVLE